MLPSCFIVRRAWSIHQLHMCPMGRPGEGRRVGKGAQDGPGRRFEAKATAYKGISKKGEG